MSDPEQQEQTIERLRELLASQDVRILELEEEIREIKLKLNDRKILAK